MTLIQLHTVSMYHRHCATRFLGIRTRNRSQHNPQTQARGNHKPWFKLKVYDLFIFIARPKGGWESPIGFN